MIFAIAAALLWLSACGDDSNKNNAGSVNAPATLVGKLYNLTSAETTSIAFAANGTTYLLVRPGSPSDSGTYTASLTGDTWHITMTSTTRPAGQDQLIMTFSAQGVGTFTFTEAGSTTPITGQFQQSQTTASAAPLDRLENTQLPNSSQEARGTLKSGTPVGAFALSDAV